MKLFILIFLFIAILPLQAVLIDFENLARNTLVTNQYQASGVIFSRNNTTDYSGYIGDVTIPDFGVYDFGGYKNALCYGTVGLQLNLTFVLANGSNAFTNAVSFRIGDGDSATESFRISLYNPTGNLLHAQEYTTTSGSVNGGVSVSYSFANIHRVEILGIGSGSGGSIDNLSFNAVQAVPEINSLLAIVMAIGILIFIKK